MIVDREVIIDVKTTRDERYDAFARQYVLLAARNKPPYPAQAYEMPQAWIDAGRAEMAAAIVRYQECRESGVWRSPTAGQVIELQRPRWGWQGAGGLITVEDGAT